eukprot:343204-Pelagomonas_calceolata.AAC.3
MPAHCCNEIQPRFCGHILCTFCRSAEVSMQERKKERKKGRLRSPSLASCIKERSPAGMHQGLFVIGVFKSWSLAAFACLLHHDDHKLPATAASESRQRGRRHVAVHQPHSLWRSLAFKQENVVYNEIRQRPAWRYSQPGQALSMLTLPFWMPLIGGIICVSPALLDAPDHHDTSCFSCLAGCP